MSALRADESLCVDELCITLIDCTLRVRTNAPALLADLAGYYSHVASDSVTPDIDIVAIERDAPELDLEFVDWKREPGKVGRKDAYVDLPGGRLVRKVRSGMVFLQSESRRVAAGPCRKYFSQLINFINSQYMNWLQNRGWLICHAAGLVHRGKGLAIAGFSGAGKSTLMLHLMQDDEVSFLTQDRLFAHAGSGAVLARGIPKLPRVNPGTIVHNTRLHSLLPAARRKALLQMPATELWNLEDKHDVPVDRLFGDGRIQQQAPLGALLILDWQHDSDRELEVERIELAARRDLLGVVMKSPGPFYQYPDGSFIEDTTPFDDERYLDTLEGVAVYVARGRVDFPALAACCQQKILA